MISNFTTNFPSGRVGRWILVSNNLGMVVGRCKSSVVTKNRIGRVMNHHTILVLTGEEEGYSLLSL